MGNSAPSLSLGVVVVVVVVDDDVVVFVGGFVVAAAVAPAVNSAPAAHTRDGI